MKQFGKILSFELKSYLKNKTFVGMTLFLVAVIAVVMFFPRIAAAIRTEDTAPEELPVLLVKAEDAAQGEMVQEAFSAAFADYDVRLTDADVDTIKAQITSGDAEGAFVLSGLTSYTYYVNNRTMYDANEAIAMEVLQRLHQMQAMLGSGMTPEQVGDVMNISIQGQTELLGKDQMQNFLYTYIMVMASVMNSNKNRISSVPAVIQMVLHLGIVVGLNMGISSDAGVSLIFVFIFIGMAFAGGVSLLWFGLAIGGIAAVFPILWQFLGQYQRNRILILFDDSIDPQGINERYHYTINLRSLTGGGLTGQGLFNGNRTQAGALFAQHTDYIFSSIGEELGFFGCVAVMILEFAIIARCIYVGIRTPDYMRRLICYGAASALIFQVVINIGMCIGTMPVIGLTLPFISYGGSSIVTIYAMMGLVSGSYARPQSMSHERYIQPYR